MFDHSEEQQNIVVDEMSGAYIHEIGRWGKFLAIVGFIVIGLMIVASVFMMFAFSRLASYDEYGNATGAAYGQAMGGMLGVLYLFFAGIYIYPTWTLYKYSTCIKRALVNKEQQEFNDAFRYLKSTFKFMGILMIIILSIYALIAIFGGLAAVVGAMNA